MKKLLIIGNQPDDTSYTRKTWSEVDMRDRLDRERLYSLQKECDRAKWIFSVAMHGIDVASHQSKDADEALANLRLAAKNLKYARERLTAEESRIVRVAEDLAAPIHKRKA